MKVIILIFLLCQIFSSLSWAIAPQMHCREQLAEFFESTEWRKGFSHELTPKAAYVIASHASEWKSALWFLGQFEKSHQAYLSLDQSQLMNHSELSEFNKRIEEIAREILQHPLASLKELDDDSLKQFKLKIIEYLLRVSFLRDLSPEGGTSLKAALNLKAKLLNNKSHRSVVQRNKNLDQLKAFKADEYLMINLSAVDKILMRSPFLLTASTGSWDFLTTYQLNRLGVFNLRLNPGFILQKGENLDIDHSLLDFEHEVFHLELSPVHRTNPMTGMVEPNLYLINALDRTEKQLKDRLLFKTNPFLLGYVMFFLIHEIPSQKGYQFIDPSRIKGHLKNTHFAAIEFIASELSQIPANQYRRIGSEECILLAEDALNQAVKVMNRELRSHSF